MSDLKNIFWLGGSPCAGKSSLSEVLAERFELDLYHVDDAFELHAQSLDPVRHPVLTRWCAATWDERWMQPVSSLLREVIACYREHFALILEDIRAASKEKPLLVEGSALLPKQVTSVLAPRNHAIWMIPSGDFQREHYAKREWTRRIIEKCDNPQAAFQNWMERDVRFAQWLSAEVSALELGLLRVDGERTLEENAMIVAGHFGLI
jgi:2-phosphoglycerate kinase